jgi:hypothetical protein
VTPLFLFRLVLDFLAVSLLLAALAYDWLGNAAHEIIGTGMFVLLLSHNIFNRRWYSTIVKSRREPRGIVTKTVNLSLLITMLTLLVTGVIISQTVFSFLSLTSNFAVRQIHALSAYLALFIAAVHLGLHWSMIMDMMCGRFGITTKSKFRTFVLHMVAILIAACGVRSLFVVNVGSKLLMQMRFEFWDFQAATPAFFLHHIAIIGLCSFLAHYSLKLIKDRKHQAAQAWP